MFAIKVRNPNSVETAPGGFKHADHLYRRANVLRLKNGLFGQANQSGASFATTHCTLNRLKLREISQQLAPSLLHLVFRRTQRTITRPAEDLQNVIKVFNPNGSGAREQIAAMCLSKHFSERGSGKLAVGASAGQARKILHAHQREIPLSQLDINGSSRRTL